MPVACNPKTLPGQAACFNCLTPGEKVTANLALLAAAYLPSQSAASVAKLAAQFRPFLGLDYLALKVFLLSKIAGVNPVPSTIEAAAECWQCIPKSSRPAVQTFLYGQLTNMTSPSAVAQLAASWRPVLEMSEMVELYILFVASGVASIKTAVAGAACFHCLEYDRLQEMALYLLCQGQSANIIPPGSVYGPGAEFDIAILPNTDYQITWGSNDVSANICGNVYNSTGTGTATYFFSGSCTLAKLFGNAAGTTVTAALQPVMGFIPQPATPTVQSVSGGNVTYAWNSPPASVQFSELWTSSDGINFSLAATVNSPGNTGTTTAPGVNATQYAKVRWGSVFGGVNSYGAFSGVVTLAGVSSDWVSRVITNGGATPSQSTINAVNTFIQTLHNNSLDTLMTYVLMFVPDSLIAALTPLYKQAGNSNDPASNHNFVAGDLGANGLTGALTKWLDSGVNGTLAPWFNAGTQSQSLAGLTCVVTNGEPAGSDLLLGATNATGGTGPDMLYANNPPMQVWNYMLNNIAGQGYMNPAAPTLSTFLSTNKATGGAAAIYAADSTNGFRQLTSIATTGGAPQNGTIAILGQNQAGTFTGTTRQFSFAAIHTGLTSAQAQTFYNAIQTLRTALGGGTV